MLGHAELAYSVTVPSPPSSLGMEQPKGSQGSSQRGRKLGLPKVGSRIGWVLVPVCNMEKGMSHLLMAAGKARSHPVMVSKMGRAGADPVLSLIGAAVSASVRNETFIYNAHLSNAKERSRAFTQCHRAATKHLNLLFDFSQPHKCSPVQSFL